MILSQHHVIEVSTSSYSVVSSYDISALLVPVILCVINLVHYIVLRYATNKSEEATKSFPWKKVLGSL